MARSKKPAKQASSANSLETSKPSLRVRVTADLIEQLRKRFKEERKEIGDVMNAVQASWGKPHHHTGISIGRLTKTVFECRVGLDERLSFIFIATPPELVIFFIGHHDEVQKLIRSLS